MLATEWITRSSFEYNTIRGEKDGSLGWQQHGAAAVSADALITAISQQIRPQAIHDDLFTRQQCWCQDLGLATTSTSVLTEKPEQFFRHAYPHRQYI